MAHKTLVDGTVYSIAKGQTLVGGTAYTISKGKTLVNGTSYTITFAETIYFYCMGDTFSCESGTTWEQYCASGGGGRFTIEGDTVCHDGVYIVYPDGYSYVYSTDTIMSQYEYCWEG